MIIDCKEVKMEKPYKIKKRLNMAGGSLTLVIPKSWLRQQAERLKIKFVDLMDLLIYDKYIELRPIK